jgi:hypothetical protein
MGIILPEIYTSKYLINYYEAKSCHQCNWKKGACLLESSNTCQTCKCSTKLVSVENSKISHAERQLCSIHKKERKA